MEVKKIFFMFCHYVVYLLGKKIKMEVLLWDIFKKGGIFKNHQDISGGPGPESSAGAKASPGRGLNL